MALHRRRVWYSGRVQGVGFRFTCERLAAGFPVAGFVRNLPDGRVELLVEGENQAVSDFLDAIEREMGRYIQSVASEPESTENSVLNGFSIRY
jgi:acylphosphatase